MLINIDNILPENLLSLSKKQPRTSVAIVSAHQSSTMESTKEAHELNLINPILIGNKKEINEGAGKLNWNISNFKIIEEDSEHEAALIAAKLAKENKIKVIVKGDLHTDILMKAYLKKEFNLLQGKRLSHI